MNAPSPASVSTTGHRMGTLNISRQGPVLHIELDDPEQGNAVTDAMLEDLLTVLTEPVPEVRAIVLSGAGEDFCLGGDRTEFAKSLDRDPAGGGIRAFGDRGRRVCEALAGNRAVTVARVHGKVIGAGLALALACDLRVGAQETVFRLPELTLGLPTAWGGLLPRLLNEVGPARVRELVLTGRAFDAWEARDLSVLQKVVPRQELDAAVQAWVRPVLRRPQGALRVTKSLLHSYSSASRLADASGLDSELMAAVLAAAHQTRDL